MAQQKFAEATCRAKYHDVCCILDETQHGLVNFALKLVRVSSISMMRW